MKLENCGRCGLEPVETKGGTLDESPLYYNCPACRSGDLNEAPRMAPFWNAAQFAARTERINAAAVALMAGDWAFDDCGTSPEQVVSASVMLIDAQDAAARVRWAEMQKGV